MPLQPVRHAGRSRQTLSVSGVHRDAFVLSAAFIAVAVAALALMPVEVGLPPLSRHMAGHIALMNVAAPILALALVRGADNVPFRRWSLAPPTVVQLVLLWLWHVPAALAAAHASPVVHVAMQATLLVSAAWFWTVVLAKADAARWTAIVALLITGKVFCLLGAVLTFAPRSLYALGAGHVMAHAEGGVALADQQLAGLLMLVACPPTYVLAGVVIAARWLADLATEGR